MDLSELVMKKEQLTGDDVYLSRTLEHVLRRTSEQFQVVLVTGARQVGKTTLLQHCRTERTYVSLDDPLVLELARNDPGLFLQRFQTPLLIDEIQYAPQLLPYIKIAADREHEPGLFWLSGSQQFHLMKEISESLAGRVGILSLMGFSRIELADKADAYQPFLPGSSDMQKRLSEMPSLELKELYETIWRGSFPDISVIGNKDRNIFYNSFVQTYLQRDIRDLTRVGDEMSFLKFLRICAARTGQILNYTDLARDADMAPNTAKSWLSILQASGIVYLLEPYYSNLSKRLIKSPKLYFLDTGLCSYLSGWSSPETLESGAMSGPIFETWVVVEILKSYHHNGFQAPLYYYRDRNKREIDLLIIRDGTVYPIEIKKTASPARKAIRHFNVLENLNVKKGTGSLICLAEESLPLSEDSITIPVRAL